MPDDDNALPAEACQAADDGGVVCKMAVAVQLLEIGKQRVDIILCVGTLGMT